MFLIKTRTGHNKIEWNEILYFFGDLNALNSKIFQSRRDYPFRIRAISFSKNSRRAKIKNRKWGREQDGAFRRNKYKLLKRNNSKIAYEKNLYFLCLFDNNLFNVCICVVIWVIWRQDKNSLLRTTLFYWKKRLALWNFIRFFYS